MIRVLIVNEKSLISNVLAAVLGDDPEIQVVGTANTVSEILNHAYESDVILVNSQRSEQRTLEFIKEITRAKVTAKIIVFGLAALKTQGLQIVQAGAAGFLLKDAIVCGLADLKTQVLQFAQAGAAGFVLKDTSVEELITHIREINAWQIDISPQIASALMSRLSEYSHMLNHVQTQALETVDLTSREIEILELVSQSLTNQQIASHLVIGVGTVKTHVHNILQKMDVSSRHEAAVTWAINNAHASDYSPF